MRLTISDRNQTSIRQLWALTLFGIALSPCISTIPSLAQEIPYAPTAPDPTAVVRLEVQNGQPMLPALMKDAHNFNTNEEIRNLDLLLSHADESGMFADIGDMRFYLPEIRKYRESLAARSGSEQNGYGSNSGQGIF